MVKSIGLVFAQVPGKQSVPRAETFAGFRALHRAAEHPIAEWWSDASYVVQGARAFSQRKNGANGDIWCSLDAESKKRFQLLPSKVKSHCTLSCVQAGLLTFHQYVGNGLADIAAGAAAEIYQQQTPVLREAERWFGIGMSVNKRLACIEARCWLAASAKKIPDP